jgi:hypothetical protein
MMSLLAEEYFRFVLSFKNINFNLNPGTKLAPSRALKNHAVLDFSEEASLPRGIVQGTSLHLQSKG